MVLIRKYPNGAEIHGPPYTKAEEDEFYARVSGGPKVILRVPKPEKDHPAESESQPKSLRRSQGEPPPT